MKFHAFLKIAASLAGGMLLLVMAVTALFLYFNEAPARSPADIPSISIQGDGSAFIEIAEGESAIAAGARLYRAGIIKSPLLWNFLCYINPEYIKAGVYEVKLPVSQTALQGILQAGRQELIRVTIPEGTTLHKMARILEDSGICSSESFMKAVSNKGILGEYKVPGGTMEGYLFPDTYLLEARYPAEMVVRKLADTFFSRLAGIGVDVPHLSPEELHKKVILASIIEREYRDADEAALIAGVFQNRLERGMRLESCATVEYIITEIQDKPHPRRLFNRDLAIDNSYNTYMYAGLPPAPISDPGLVALRAAFFPQTSNFLFFRLVDPSSGRHYFSKDFDEHIRAGELLVKGNR
jgi:UPF0755 protein